MKEKLKNCVFYSKFLTKIMLGTIIKVLYIKFESIQVVCYNLLLENGE